jgi:hypothetical protein
MEHNEVLYKLQHMFGAVRQCYTERSAMGEEDRQCLLLRERDHLQQNHLAMQSLQNKIQTREAQIQQASGLLTEQQEHLSCAEQEAHSQKLVLAQQTAVLQQQSAATKVQTLEHEALLAKNQLLLGEIEESSYRHSKREQELQLELKQQRLFHQRIEQADPHQVPVVRWPTLSVFCDKPC